MKVGAVGAEVFHANRRTERDDEAGSSLRLKLDLCDELGHE